MQLFIGTTQVTETLDRKCLHEDLNYVMCIFCSKGDTNIPRVNAYTSVFS